MITARVQKNLITAKEYFREHLATGEYHSEGQQVGGRWFGKGVQRLGLEDGAQVTQACFEQLCETQHPMTGEALTPRRRQVNRRVCYDFVVSAPKSVSIMALTVGDGRLIHAHEAAARIAMAELEREAATRIRQHHADGTRVTGEIAAAQFTHTTSRAMDPQLHTHYVVFNATWDAKENRWKALQTERMFERMTLFTEIYRGELARQVQEFGYGIRNTPNGFELQGVSTEILDRFSKRRRAILNEEARIEAKLGSTLSNNARATIAHTSRQAKTSDLTAEQIRAFQRAQLTIEELQSLSIPGLNTPSRGPEAAVMHDAIHPLVERPTHATPTFPLELAPAQPAVPIHVGEQRPHPMDQPEAVKAAVDYARDHHFERLSVVPRWAFVRECLIHGRGQVTAKAIEAEISSRPDLIDWDGQLTTKEAIHLEARMIALVNGGIDSGPRLVPGYRAPATLSTEQAAAAERILGSADFVTALRGRAGTGKTTLVRELVRGLRSIRHALVLAPSSASVAELRGHGFPATATVQRFLASERMQRMAAGKVIIVDEAGLIATRDMVRLLEIAKSGRCRVILAGDTRQHASVEAGDALRLLESRSALAVAEVHGVRRQVSREYREAIEAMAAGQGPEGLERLRSLGAIREIPSAERYEVLAGDYCESIRQGKTSMVISPTWREIEQITNAIRAKLKDTGRLGTDDTEVLAYRSLKWTRAQKRDLRLYSPGLGLHFHRSTARIDAGETLRIEEVGHGFLVATHADGRRSKITAKQTGCFDVAEPVSVAVSRGERLLLLATDKARGLYNGQVVEVSGVEPSGTLRLADGRVLPPSFRGFTHGYCSTSHASQGRTADHVYVAVDSSSIHAAHLNQFYVSCSRGRHLVRVYTDDVEFLAQAVTKNADRLTATELMESAAAKPAVRNVTRARLAA